MADLAGGAARRRRERRLRSWLRHERMTVRMELAAALHHSAGPETNDAVRSQKTVSSRGVRPGVLQDPAPQLVSEHAACPCSSGVPSHSLPALADAAGDAVDSTTLRFLTAAALKLRQMEEEEERKLVELEVKRKESELQSLAEATRMMAQQRATGSSSWTSAAFSCAASSRSLRGEKRKKRKKKLPKTSSGYGRPFVHHRRVPAVHSSVPVHPQTLGLPCATQRQVPTVHSFMLPVQFLDKVRDMPVVVLRQVLRSIVSKTVVIPQLQSIGGRLPFFVPQRQITMVQTVQQTTEIPLMPFVLRWSMPCCADFALHRLFISVHSALLGSTADTCGASVYGVFHFLCVWWIMVPQVDSRPALFQRLLGSTVNTSLCVSRRGWSSWSQCT